MRTPTVRVTINDCVVQTFRAGGNGGQNQNKRDTGVRVIHPPSGARSESRVERSQLLNKRAAFKKMAETPEMQRWLRIEHARAIGQVDDWVEKQMRPENLLVELGPF